MMWRKVRIGFLGAGAALMLLLCGVSGHEDAEIDLNSGQLKITRYIFFEIPVSREVRSTPFSQLVEKYSRPQSPPLWKLARRSQHGLYALTCNVDTRYNSVLASMHMHFLSLAIEELDQHDIDPGAQREIVEEIMGYLQSGDPRAAERRANEVVQEDSDISRAQRLSTTDTNQ